MIVERATTTGSPEQLWSLVGAPERWGELLPTFDSVRRVGGPAVTDVGSRFEVRQPGLARAIYEVTAWEPGRGFTWESRLPGIWTTAEHRVSGVDGRTQLELRLHWSGPLAWLIRRSLAGRASEMMRNEAETLCELARRA
ncbi:SRPBCC family protein [Ammonicoccus fulvus]|uniref:SRPBCC family protein n=1 Tax=Ammonicoccus fulvus TaxID=3138240 RepID=A0ABZ3FSL0_9ACTN